MKTSIEQVKNLRELASYLAKMNQQKETHIGFCGEKPEEIYETLKEDFVDENGDVKFWRVRNDLGEFYRKAGFKTKNVLISYRLI